MQLMEVLCHLYDIYRLLAYLHSRCQNITEHHSSIFRFQNFFLLREEDDLIWLSHENLGRFAITGPSGRGSSGKLARLRGTPHSGLCEGIRCESTPAIVPRNPSGTLLPFLGSGIPYIIYQQKKVYPYCNMVTGLPRYHSHPKPETLP